MSDHAVPGVRLAAACAGLYSDSRLDVAVLEAAPEAQAAAVFTTNRFCAAPVEVARAHLQATAPRLLLINAGCANAGMGADGLADAHACCAAAAAVFGVEPEEVLPFSTGVIGQRLPVERIEAQLPTLNADLSEEHWDQAAQAILTTDTCTKLHSRQVEVAGQTLHVTGMAKGAGMICPDMATLLAFVATDVVADAPTLQTVLNTAMKTSFHAITVDGDTSTNDACVLLATGASKVELASLSSEEKAAWEQAVQEVCTGLAQDLIRDAEGATRFITVEVEQASSEVQAQAVARAVAHSPLVKTAAFAGDPNWGRILAAVGRSVDADVRMEDIDIWLDEVCIVAHGACAPDYQEADGQRVMQRPEFAIRINLRAGSQGARLYTSDLSYEYVKINAEYRT